MMIADCGLRKGSRRGAEFAEKRPFPIFSALSAPPRESRFLLFRRTWEEAEMRVERIAGAGLSLETCFGRKVPVVPRSLLHSFSSVDFLPSFPLSFLFRGFAASHDNLRHFAVRLRQAARGLAGVLSSLLGRPAMI